MRKIFSVLLALGLFGLQQPSGAQVVHVNNTFETKQLPVSPSLMNSRIEAAADKYQQYAPIPRYVQYDFASPRDAQEYADLQGYGVVLVSVLTQVPGEMPPKRLYANFGEKTVPLVLYLSGSTSAPPAPTVNRVFGSFRWEGIYLLPMYLVGGGAQLVMDFAINREGFVVTKFGDQEREGLTGLPVAAPASDAPPATALIKFLTREYPGFDANRAGSK